MNAVTGFTETFIAGPYALAASPARYAVERGDWKAAAALQVRASPLAHVQAAYVGAAKAAETSGESAKAHEYYSKVVVIADAADNSRSEVTDARAFLTKR